ncbi:tumor necrosis factor ligand superfamily member 10 [Perognathus longimembris pacificus]|uniref:tumor necrosis factor ligand superfamily member 10 n=1 Tax=Perognathus longimembris pacificus TaxID=214514 RepID=UPI0020189017|nr:tumor necrosis factor ligand superfamily member 10 [Perognathus longimembris pacificus]
MALLRSPADPNLRQLFGLIVTFTILLQVALQAVSVAVTYIYFSNELKQMQKTYSKSITACFLEEADSWGFRNEEAMNSPCWLMKKQLETLVRKMVLRNFEETAPTMQEKQQSFSSLPRDQGPQRVAAHITGTLRRSSAPSAPRFKNDMVLGQKIHSWESSRKGHSFLSNLHLRNGELVIHKAGLYYIYSQTYFRFQEPEDTSVTGSRKQVKQMVQYVYKYTNYPEPILLMKSARNSCWAKDSEYGLYSIYQGGIFELKEDDRIFVSVTNESLIDLEQEASYFGVFLVG